MKNTEVDYNLICDLMKTQEGRKKLIEDYSCKIDTALSGVNEDGEMILLSINKDGIVLTTYLNNNHIQTVFYDEYGYEAEVKFGE